MSKKVSIFTKAINARIETEKKKQTMSATNLKKLERAANAFSNEKIVSLLKECDTSTDFANQNVYTIEKLLNMLQVAAANTRINIMSKHIFLTAMKCATQKQAMLFDYAKLACSSDQKLTAEQKKVVSQRAEITSAQTVAAQSQSSVAALRALNILKSIAHEKSNSAFEVQTDNAMFKALSEHLESAQA